MHRALVFLFMFFPTFIQHLLMMAVGLENYINKVREGFKKLELGFLAKPRLTPPPCELGPRYQVEK